MAMSAIKHGEKNVQKGDAPKNPGGWEKKNQGENRTGPGHEGALSETDGNVLKDGVHNRYSMLPGSSEDGTQKQPRKQ